MVGDRDPRSEDRQLLLDALMAAEERLVVIFAGADPRTGSRIPPAVPIGELLDALDTTARTPDGRSRSRAASPSAIPCSRSPRSTSLRASWAPRPGSASTGRACAAYALRPFPTERTPPAVFRVDSLPAAPPTTALGLTELHPLLQPPAAGAAPGTRPAVPVGRRRGAGRADPGRAGRAGALAGRRTAASAAPAGRRPRRLARRGVAPRHAPAARLRRPGAHRSRRRGCRPGGPDRTVPDRRRSSAGRSCSTCRAQPSRPADRVGRPAVRRSPGPGQLLRPSARSTACRAGSSCWP